MSYQTSSRTIGLLGAMLLAFVALLALIPSCSRDADQPWIDQLVQYQPGNDPSDRDWDRIVAAAAGDPLHVQILRDLATTATAAEQAHMARLLRALAYDAVRWDQPPQTEYLEITDLLQDSQSPEVLAELALTYMYFPLEQVADPLAVMAFDDAQPQRIRLLAIRSIRLSKRHWPDSPHPASVGPGLRTLVDRSPDTRIVLAALWAEATLGTLDTATLDATLPKLIAADPSLENDDRVEEIRRLLAR